MMSNTLYRDVAVSVFVLLALITLPFASDNLGVRDFIIFVSAYGLLAMSLNLLIGNTGMISFGHGMFFASGAYAFALMMQSGQFSIPAAFLLSVLSSAALALVIGAICVRLKEIYFAFLTLAFQMLIHSIILSWVSLTGGDQGLVGGIPRPPFLGIDLSDNLHLYIFSCAILLACVFAMRQLVTSPFGYTLRMIRDNQERAAFLGIDVFRMKLIVFVIAGSIASVGGIILALFVSGAYPNFAFWTTSGEAIFMIMLGGTVTFLGPLIGAIILTMLSDFVTVYTEHYGLVLGSIILLFALVLRRGMLDSILEFWDRRRAPSASHELAGEAAVDARD